MLPMNNVMKNVAQIMFLIVTIEANLKVAQDTTHCKLHGETLYCDFEFTTMVYINLLYVSF